VIEGDNRIKGLDKLKNEEEYTEAKRKFNYYMSEYEWVSNSKNPKGEIEDELRECSKELHADMEQDEERNLLSKIQTLKTKYIQVARGEYAANLKGNISALLLMLEQYEASNEKRNFYDLTKGIFKGDPDTKEYLKKKYMLSWSNMYGVTKAPESLNVEPMEDILDYMAKNYDLVDIDLSDRKDGKEETALAIVYTEPGSIEKGIRANINKMVEERLGVLDKENDKVREKEENNKQRVANVAPGGIKHEKSVEHDKKEQDKGEIDIW